MHFQKNKVYKNLRTIANNNVMRNFSKNSKMKIKLEQTSKGDNNKNSSKR